MILLGLQLGHNATVALMEDGQIIRAVSQEKFDNIKNSSSFPTEAIQWTLRDAGINAIDAIAISGVFVMPQQMRDLTTGGERYKAGWERKIKDQLLYWLLQIKGLHSLYFWYVTKKAKRSSFQAKKQLMKKIRDSSTRSPGATSVGMTEKILYFEHHVCHASSSFHSLAKNPLEDALIFTLDGSGDYFCATVNVARKGKIARIASTPRLYSLGYLYALVTVYLGMKSLEHEYKVMGLAPFAKEEKVRKVYERVFKPLIFLNPENPLEFRSLFPTNRSLPYLKKHLSCVRFDVVSGAVQMLLETLVTEWIRKSIEKTGVRTVYTGGGVFMNVKLNKKIMEMPEIEKAFFMPSCGDESNPFGTANEAYKTLTGLQPKPLTTLYLGPMYTNQEVNVFLQEKRAKSHYRIEFFENMEKKIAELLALFQVVARLKGRAEWGARALGNRSILANPSDMKSFFEVNDQIKQRDFWMPFAPSILAEDHERYIKNPKNISAPHMILAFDSTPLGIEHCRAAMHQADKTLRPQIVKPEDNASYHQLISDFKAMTGIGAVMNTSMNLHGYPLVATLEQAFWTFENSGLKYLALENYLISKKLYP